MDVVRKKRSVTYNANGYGPMSKYMLLRTGPVPAQLPTIPVPGIGMNAVLDQMNFILDRQNVAIVEISTPVLDSFGMYVQARRITLLDYPWLGTTDGVYFVVPKSIQVESGNWSGNCTYNRICDWLFNPAMASVSQEITAANSTPVGCVCDYGNDVAFNGFKGVEATISMSVRNRRGINADTWTGSSWSSIGYTNREVPTYVNTTTSKLRMRCSPGAVIYGFQGFTTTPPEILSMPEFTHAIWIGDSAVNGQVPAMLAELSYDRLNPKGLTIKNLTPAQTSNLAGDLASSPGIYLLPYLQDGQRL